LQNELANLSSELDQAKEELEMMRESQAIRAAENILIPKGDLKFFSSEVNRITRRLISELEDHNPLYPATVVNPWLNTSVRVP